MSKPAYPLTEADLIHMPACPVQWPHIGSPCIPMWDGECANCGEIVSQPKPEGVDGY